MFLSGFMFPPSTMLLGWWHGLMLPLKPSQGILIFIGPSGTPQCQLAVTSTTGGKCPSKCICGGGFWDMDQIVLPTSWSASSFIPCGTPSLLFWRTAPWCRGAMAMSVQDMAKEPPHLRAVIKAIKDNLPMEQPGPWQSMEF